MVRFFPDTLLLRMRLKLCRRDFFNDLTLDRGPSIANESLGCRVHLGDREQQSDVFGSQLEFIFPPPNKTAGGTNTKMSAIYHKLYSFLSKP